MNFVLAFLIGGFASCFSVANILCPESGKNNAFGSIINNNLTTIPTNSLGYYQNVNKRLLETCKNVVSFSGDPELMDDYIHIQKSLCVEGCALEGIEYATNYSKMSWRQDRLKEKFDEKCFSFCRQTDDLLEIFLQGFKAAFPNKLNLHQPYSLPSLQKK